MSGNKWGSTKYGAKLLSTIVVFSMFSCQIPLHFHKSIPVVPLKYLMHILTGISTKQL